MSRARERVHTDGKFLKIGDQVFRVRGVTYGGFRARLDGWRFPDTVRLKKDLVSIARAGLNTVRTYEVPPPEMVEIASEQGLRLIVGLDCHDWRMEPHPGRRARRRILDAGRRAVAGAIELLAEDTCVLAVAVGNELPVDLVRLHGAGAIEDTLSRLLADVHDADPGMLATYVNFPTTEFLEPEGQDVIAFNVFLEEPEALRRYLKHLQVVSRDKPLLLTELGLAGDVHGEPAQADTLAWQLRAVDQLGCAGATVYAWTDEWAVDDASVRGWGFGITTEEREPKAALEVVEEWARSSPPLDLRSTWPRVSVIVCTYNEERNIERCLASLQACDYPDLEVIVCDDGSTDATVEIARRFPFRVLPMPFVGLAGVRNAGLEAATGDIVAYLDADAACHREWPYHLVLSLDEDVAATGGPNLPWPRAGFVERAVALSPGAPVEVLLTDDRAEHVAGCNMAFHKESLSAVAGFDPAFVSAGDDVDVCWKLLDAGGEIGFSPAAQVLHHRRGSVGGYLRQQRGYGRAERMLSGLHRNRFNRLGQARWRGFVYGGSSILPGLLRPLVYTGHMGSAPFQPVVRRRSEIAAGWVGALLPLALPLMLVGAVLSVLSAWWLLVPGVLVALLLAWATATAVAAKVPRTEPKPLRLRALVGALHVAQPIARVWGRITGRPIRSTPPAEHPWVGDRTTWLRALRGSLEVAGCTVEEGGAGSSWDLRAMTGMSAASITTAVAWKWEPRHRVRYLPRPWLVFVIVLGIVLLAAGFVWGWALLGLALVAAGFDALRLRGRVNNALRKTTLGARR